MRYAKPGGTGDCSSWANACALQTALTGATSGDEIWAAAGEYKPTTGADRQATFQLIDGVAVYGGFAGTETARDQRDPAANVTILRGDLNGDDVGFTNNGDNSYHVVTGADDTTLDGFTISGGNADGAYPNELGGGMNNDNGSSPTLTNVTFSGNSASYGGGMYNDGGGAEHAYLNPTLTNVTFSNNSASTSGGGMLNDDSNPWIRNTIFWGNTTTTLGAQIYNDSDSTPRVSDSVVEGGYAGGTNIITADPMLGALGDYGGFTQTVPLQAGSSAIDTGNDAVCPATDQRGVSRPQGAHCDIGAYEYIDTTAPIMNTFTVTTPSNSLTIPITAFSATDNVAVTGYLITTSSTPPAAGAAGWTGTTPTTYTVVTDGSYTLYPWAKDAAGNVSALFASPRAVVVDAFILFLPLSLR